MNIELKITLISTIISSIIATITALIVVYKANKHQEKLRLDNELTRIIEISLTYPYLEHQTFINKWPEKRNGEDERYMRYDIFCNLIFNYLEKLFNYYSGDIAKIESELNVRDWVISHKLAWQKPSVMFENIDGYSQEFKTFIGKYIE